MTPRHRKALIAAKQRERRCKDALRRYTIVGLEICKRHANLLTPPSLFEAQISELLERLSGGIEAQRSAGGYSKAQLAWADVIQHVAADPRNFYVYCRRHPERVRAWIADAKRKTPSELAAPKASRIINQSGTRHVQDITTLPPQ